MIRFLIVLLAVMLCATGLPALAADVQKAAATQDSAVTAAPVVQEATVCENGRCVRRLVTIEKTVTAGPICEAGRCLVAAPVKAVRVIRERKPVRRLWFGWRGCCGG